MSWINDLGVLVKESDIVNRVSNAVSVLANKLGVAAAHVYEVFTKQVIAESIAHIVIYIITFFIIALSGFSALKLNKKTEYDSYGNPQNIYSIAQIISAIIFVIFGLIGSIYFFSTITNTVTGLINPEYRVIHEIAEMIKPTSVPNK